MHWFATFGVIAVIFIAWQMFDEYTAAKEFKPRRDMSRFISDEEFLAACSVKDPEIAFKVRAIISDQLDFPVNHIHPDDRLTHELGAW